MHFEADNMIIFVAFGEKQFVQFKDRSAHRFLKTRFRMCGRSFASSSAPRCGRQQHKANFFTIEIHGELMKK